MLGYISPIFPDARHGVISTNFCTAVEIVDVITCDNFWRSVKGRLFCMGSKMESSQAILAVNTLLTLLRSE